MDLKENHIKSNKKNIIRYLYLISLLFLVLTGFGQMPVFKRYYIADIPGLGWLAQFFVTHYMHYLFAILFLGITVFIITEYFLTNRKKIKITPSGYIRGAVLFGLVITGGLLVIRNLASSNLPSGLIIFLDLSHLGLVMIFLMAGLYCLVFRKKWYFEIKN
ncbi:MAG: hypothetical protein GY797_29995 [Deltaproteobacteria bacterium]|nr:hypothetical protein [Deltaproteobacteria bacterium]